MSGLSERARRLYRQAERPESYPGLSPDQVAALFDPERQRRIAITGLDEAGAPHTPALVDFGVRYGGRGYHVRGDPPYRMTGILEAWRRIGGPQGIESARGKRIDRGWIVQCMEAYAGRGFPAHEISELWIGEDGTIYLPGTGGAQEWTALASCYDRWLEFEAVLDELGGAGAWMRLTIEGVPGMARALAEALALAPAPEASDGRIGVWSSNETTLRSRPAGGGAWIAEIFTRDGRSGAVEREIERLSIPRGTGAWARWPVER